MRESIRTSGVVDAYHKFLGNIRLKGLPKLLTGEFGDDGGASGDVFEYAAWYLSAIHEETKARKRAERMLKIE